ncbi:Diacylglycerol kinase family enzyme [Promicromonospora thailandica]|uniref:Diacylglycerol kinase family enzyme n=2 Tax=Promicromonospora thailandica TaxID=765201 RepID=A0A9X2G6L2_9MICO|nr:Diacylglycerol kinase family enzyme [Promicromonospora thailandica]
MSSAGLWKHAVMTRLAIIWNPSKTSRENLETALEAVIEAAPDDGAAAATDVRWYETSPEDAGHGTAARAVEEGAEVLVAAGGDGTVRAVAAYLGESGADADLAIVPLGTGNLLARNLGVPVGDVPAAFARALAPEARPVDLGWLEADLGEGPQRLAFAVMAGFGLDAHMITETNDDLKDRVGWLAYVESLGRALTASETLEVTLAADDGEPERTTVHTLLVGNCGMLQGGITLLPDADPRDGELDLLLLSAQGAAGWADTVRNMVWDNGLKRLATGVVEAQSSDSAAHGRVRALRVELAEPRVLEIDGEDLGTATAFAVEVQAAAVRVR